VTLDMAATRQFGGIRGMRERAVETRAVVVDSQPDAVVGVAQIEPYRAIRAARSRARVTKTALANPAAAPPRAIPAP
jgi:hypothetical protein